MAKTVFYSFHYDRDVHRVQLVRNINVLVGQILLNSQDWEAVRQRGSKAIETWIDEQMSYKRAVIVLIGQETASRPWVLYEIGKAWQEKRPMLGIRIHGLSSMGTVDAAGANPFNAVGGVAGVPVFDPTARDWSGKIDSKETYANLARNLDEWSSMGKVRY